MTFRLSYITYAKLMINKKPASMQGFFDYGFMYIILKSTIYVGYTKTATGRAKFRKEIKKQKSDSVI